MNTRMVESFDGVKIVYDVAASGVSISPESDQPTLVFIHGWACNRSHWVEQVTAFSDLFTVVTIDLAGHGDASFERTDYSIESFARDVKTVLDREQIERAVLVGHSMGGMVIAHTARLLGGRVIGLIGADTFKFVRDDPRTGKQAAQAERITADYEAAIESIVASMFADNTSDELRRSISEGMLTVPKQVAIGAMRGMANDVAMFDLIAGLQIPKFTINATGRPMDESSAKEAGIEVRFLPTVSHFVMNEDPVGFNQLLDKALNAIDS
ncbi:MAG: alpha/beta hydrolase [Chloroflexi bacterium]|jgi:pimeloyl-ACP methyl ester carboxylesterase|nr:alpha/beta hydrolase [Chloroflexota bacterium]